MKINKLLFLIIALSAAQINAVSVVYNMKIRRLFTLGAQVLNPGKSKLIGSVVPIFYKRDRHIVQVDAGVDAYEKSLTGGAILNLRFVAKKKWWLEGTTGIEKESLKSCGTLNFKTSRTGIDDIILSGGYNFLLNDKSQFVLYGLAGFPTRTDVTALERFNTLVGTRFFGLGVGTELSYAPINTLERSLVGITQFRFVHFFDRKWFPILPRNAKIQPGNITDILLTLQCREKLNVFEMGYNPTFFTNQAVVLATEKINADTFIRQSGYFTYMRLFKQLPGIALPGLIGCGLSISKTEQFDTRAVSIFLNFSALF
ncbi:MAG: hypothetical protein P4L22_06455 [Candidatus Babeliales bacterium]|nr:hypothetical protein [Candidatus Babeliales bacterium]